jgi:hypothetical protein
MIEPEHEAASLAREFLGYALAQAHPMLRDWRGEKLEAELRANVEVSVETVGDDAEAQRIAEVVHRLGLPASRYKGRLLGIGELRCIAHIDFPDPSGEFPFVKIRCANLPPGSIADWRPLARGMARAFAEFAPRAMHFFHPAHVPLRALGARISRHLLAAPARTVAERPDAPGCDRLELRRSASLDFYPHYAAAYEQMLEERPRLRGEVRVEAPDSLAECLEQGLLYEVFVDGAWSGLIAARRDSIAGVSGLQMVEIVLTRGARGQGLGVAVHRRFARAVAVAAPAAILMGTIAAENMHSLQTAAGRSEIGAWHWFDL